MTLDNWALVIGVNEYSLPQYRLNGAVNDAMEVRKWLLSQEGGKVPPENLFLLLSDDVDVHVPPHTEQATTQKIIDAARKLIVKSGGHGDRLFFYFAGHGLSNYEYGEQEAICPSDFDPTRTNFTTISIDSITNYLETIQFKEQYFFFDACRNIPFKQPFRIGYFSDIPRRDHALPPVQQFIFYATSPGLKATEMGFAGNEQGTFTKALLDGLRGKEKAKIYDPMSDKYVIKADRLIEFLREEVRKTLTSDFESFTRYPRLSGERDRGTVLASFPSASFPTVDLDIFIEPAQIASQVEISVKGGVAAPPKKADTLPVKFSLPESDYGIIATSAQYEPKQKPWPVELYSPQSLTIEMIEAIPKGEQDPDLPDTTHLLSFVTPHHSQPTATPPIGIRSADTVLHVRSPDRFAPMEISDVIGNVVKAGFGYLYLRKPGLYRAKLFSSDGQTYEQLVVLDEGEEKEITLHSSHKPTISSSIMQETGFKVLEDNTLDVSEDVGPMTGPKLATVLALASRATDYTEQEWSATRLRKFGLSGFKKLTNSAQNGLHLLVSNDAQADKTNGHFIEDLKIRFWPMTQPIPTTPERLLPASIQDFAEFAMSAAPGSYWISFESENRQPVVFSLAVLPERITLVILQRNKDGKITVFQYLPTSSGHNHREEIDHVRTLDILQQYYTSDILDYVYENILNLAGSKGYDPNAGAVAGFLMFKNLKKREKQSIRIISQNMAHYFGEMPDSFVLKGMSNEIEGLQEEAVRSYRTALERGVPIFSEGLASLCHAIKKYDLDQTPNAQIVKSAFEQRIGGTIWSCWTPTSFHPSEFIKC